MEGFEPSVPLPVRRRGSAQMPATDKLPLTPAHLNARAKAVWKRVVTELQKVGVLSALDLDVFASYAVVIGAVEKTTQRLKREDLVVLNARGKASANPLFRMRENAIATMRALAVELGITPSARLHLRVTPPKAKDPFEAFLDGDDGADDEKVLQ